MENRFKIFCNLLKCICISEMKALCQVVYSFYVNNIENQLFIVLTSAIPKRNIIATEPKIQI